MWHIDYNYILSGPTSLNKYLKHIKNIIDLVLLSWYYVILRLYNYIIKQLLTFISVDMLFCKPLKSDIDLDSVSVNITFPGSAKQHIDLNKSQ